MDFEVAARLHPRAQGLGDFPGAVHLGLVDREAGDVGACVGMENNNKIKDKKRKKERV